ncbi:oligopeptide ABC transporter permease [Bacillus suaedaesalsae]|uniref:ABC transporter permease n=1 Tax=Bacillus suaedaesalsae TaxID=2810349 RepID=A0ABS2DIH2_9BACI|nr:oligopeptide ABC transporter permease [Bacillus suaedaesalsae]MBM6618280.1 ABC transporter permease [Bacillus suaedaesalsae]
MNTEQNISKELFQPAQIDLNKSERIEKPSLTYWQDAWLRLRKNKAALFGLVMVIIVIAMAFIGPLMTGYGIDDQDLSRAKMPPKVPVLENIGWLSLDGKDSNGNDVYAAKGKEGEYYYFGTDGLGRDIWTRTWEGTQISLFIAFAAAIIDMVIGVAYGGISAYYGGRVDNYMMRFIEILIGIPNLVVVILMILVLEAGLTSIIIALTITGWTGMARIVRGQVLKLKNQEFVLASRTLGAPDSKIIMKHLIPNVLGIVIINAMFSIPSAIFFEAFLSFIGLGLQAPNASLGVMIEDGYRSLQIFPHMMIFPAVVMSILMIGFNLLADGLRDALDPKMRD